MKNELQFNSLILAADDKTFSISSPTLTDLVYDPFHKSSKAVKADGNLNLYQEKAFYIRWLRLAKFINLSGEMRMFQERRQIKSHSNFETGDKKVSVDITHSSEDWSKDHKIHSEALLNNITEKVSHRIVLDGQGNVNFYFTITWSGVDASILERLTDRLDKLKNPVKDENRPISGDVARGKRIIRRWSWFLLGQEILIEIRPLQSSLDFKFSLSLK